MRTNFWVLKYKIHASILLIRCSWQVVGVGVLYSVLALVVKGSRRTGGGVHWPRRSVGPGEKNTWTLWVVDKIVVMLTYVVTANEQSFPLSTWILLENHFKMKVVWTRTTSSTTSWWRSGWKAKQSARVTISIVYIVSSHVKIIFDIKITSPYCELYFKIYKRCYFI